MKIQIAIAASTPNLFDSAYNKMYKAKLDSLSEFKKGRQVLHVPVAKRLAAIENLADDKFVPHVGYVAYLDGDVWRIDPHAFCVKDGKVYEVTNAYDWEKPIRYFGEPAGQSLQDSMNTMLQGAKSLTR